MKDGRIYLRIGATRPAYRGSLGWPHNSVDREISDGRTAESADKPMTLSDAQVCVGTASTGDSANATQYGTQTPNDSQAQLGQDSSTVPWYNNDVGTWSTYYGEAGFGSPYDTDYVFDPASGVVVSLFGDSIGGFSADGEISGTSYDHTDTGQVAPDQSPLALTDGCPAPPQKELTADQELALIRNAYKYATNMVLKEQKNLGWGWMGNLSRCGPQCTVVHDSYLPHLQTYLNKHLNGARLRHYTPVSVFDSGKLPAELDAHVYLGIGTVPKNVGGQSKLHSWCDPWRYGDAQQYVPGTGPNSPDTVYPVY